jgi:hypothetical protein
VALLVSLLVLLRWRVWTWTAIPAYHEGRSRIGRSENCNMAKASDEQMMERLLRRQHEAGVLGEIDMMKMLEEFRSARAQRKAASYALYAAIAAAVSALFAIASVVVSIIALHSK